MRSTLFAAALAGIAAANPLPQELDFSVIDNAAPIPSVTIPVVDISATTVSVDIAAATSSIAAAVEASAVEEKRAIKKRGSCATQAAGAGPLTTPDTAPAFLANPVYASIASAAPVPTGYTQSFVNLQGSNNAYGYMGYTTLKTYDTNKCAAKCTAINGCNAFNLYFERDPSLDPDNTNCPDPASTTNIKCVFWGGPVTTANANNLGQYRAKFQVVIAGSNGYISNNMPNIPGYGYPSPLGQNAINAPLDCHQSQTYMGVQIFTSGPFDPLLCSAFCASQTAYNVAHPPETGAPMTCQFFNTYILLLNGTSVGQYCSLYNETWAPSYATNSGQYRGADHYTIEYSFSYSNTTNPGTCK